MAQTFNSRVQYVALAYKRLLKIKVTDSTFLREIEENPFYPSLLSISDTFNQYQIPHAAFRVSPEEFDELEEPFIALINIPSIGDDFVLVTKITSGTVSFIYDKNQTKTIAREKFIKSFKNVAFLAQYSADAEEKDYAKKLETESDKDLKSKLWLALSLLCICIIVFVNIPPLVITPFVIVSILKIIGLSFTVLLLTHDVDNTNVFVKNICSGVAKINCDAVLGSRVARLFGTSWSEIGFFYFSFTSLVLFSPGLLFVHKLAWLSIFNALAIPIIFISIYLQWRVIKQWCPLCLGVQLILELESIWSFTFFWLNNHSPSILFDCQYRDFLQIIFLGFLPLLAWYRLKPIILSAINSKQYKNAYKRLKYNSDLFNSLLAQQPKGADNWEKLGIDFGNTDASNTIIKVCSPYCGPCAEMHPKLKEIIKQNSNIKLKVIFTARNDESDVSTSIVKHLLAISSRNNTTKTQQAFDDWYLSPVKDYQAFSNTHPINIDLKTLDSEVEAMSLWCTKSEIVHTPTIVNRQLKVDR